jgi:hypothetical protein
MMFVVSLCSSCTDQSVEDRSYVLASGELVRAIVVDGDRSISGTSALCFEITIIEELVLVSDSDYLSFDDLVRDVDLMAGWSNVEVRLDSRLEDHFVFSAARLAHESAGNSVFFAAPPCPE